jgi:hypothetical protein
MPRQIWVELHDQNERDACDVIVEMEDGAYYTAVFVTLPYLQRQMVLSYDVCTTLPDTAPVRYATLETPHIVVADLNRETIEDTIDNLLALDTFHSVFTQVTDEQGNELVRAQHDASHTPKRATAEVAAVVLNEVLITSSAELDDTSPTLPTVKTAAPTTVPPTATTVA